jgi:hypothetical protein
MFKTLVIKLLVQFGSDMLLRVAKATVSTLQARKDNNLDLGADTVKLILQDVAVTK